MCGFGGGHAVRGGRTRGGWRTRGGAALPGLPFDADWTAHFVRFDTPGSPGNFQRVIESRFVYGLRPVYERLRADWPGVGLRLPTHARPTRRQIPIMGGVVTVPVILLAWLLWQILGL